jgi:hypothetical protein
VPVVLGRRRACSDLELELELLAASDGLTTPSAACWPG